MHATLYPSFVYHLCIDLHLSDPRSPEQRFPDIQLPEGLRRAVHKRQLEFLGGRWCAREGLRALAHPHADAPVGQGPRHEPVFPRDVVGAITHAAGFASAAVARRSDARGVGLDVERLMPDEQADSLRDLIASRDELSALERTTGWSTADVLTLVFSAKETIFKCLYAEVGRFFDFREAAVYALDDGEFRARLLATLGPAFPQGFEVRGRFQRVGELVWTAMVLPL